MCSTRTTRAKRAGNEHLFSHAFCSSPSSSSCFICRVNMNTRTVLALETHNRRAMCTVSTALEFIKAEKQILNGTSYAYECIFAVSILFQREKSRQAHTIFGRILLFTFDSLCVRSAHTEFSSWYYEELLELYVTQHIIPFPSIARSLFPSVHSL